MAAHKTVIILAVALTDALIGEHTPTLLRFRSDAQRRTLRPSLPAVTCTVQSSMLTGVSPARHGVVANGWYDRESAEVRFWKQSNRLVHGEKVWETARRRDPAVMCSQMFWWFNMYSSAEFSVTPRPQYRADGRKIPDCYSHPAQLRDRLQEELGPFPLFRFWGPAASIESTAWIARASVRVDELHDPALTFIYLPHLDYALQKFGPEGPEARAAAAELDGEFARLLTHYRARGARVVLVSEYGIEPVSGAVAINRVLREAGGVAVREENGRELLDPGASAAFALADHQVAHVYVREPSDVTRYRDVCARTPGVERVLGVEEQRAEGIHHERSGELVLVAEPGRWFSYPYWLDDARAPDFARTVDIHRKPGYDPVELFLDPKLRMPKLTLAGKLARKKLGFRTLMDVIPLDDGLVKGSHGRVQTDGRHAPVLLADAAVPLPGGEGDTLACERVRDIVLASLFDDRSVVA